MPVASTVNDSAPLVKDKHTHTHTCSGGMTNAVRFSRLLERSSARLAAMLAAFLRHRLPVNTTSVTLDTDPRLFGT